MNTLTLKKPISRDDILVQEKSLGRRELVPPSWDLNDFGPRGYQVGDTDIFVHTTQPTEDQYNQKLQEQLEFSHGCIHVKPSERDKLEETKLLKAGATSSSGRTCAAPRPTARHRNAGRPVIVRRRLP